MQRFTKIVLAAAATLSLGLLAVTLGTGAFASGVGYYAMGPGMMGGHGRGMMGGYGPGREGGNGPNTRRGNPDLDSRAGRAFARICSQCHRLPDPRQHSAQQWPAVVERMERYMNERNMPLPDGQVISAIEHFLAQHTYAGR